MRWTSLKSLAGLSLSLLACNTAEVFPYKYYGLDVPDYDGELLGAEDADDLPFSMCQPTAQHKGNCVVMFTEEFKALRLERARLKEIVKDCQALANE